MSSLSTNRTQISIFDIPHILDLICDDLSKDQLLTCLEVSRAWRVNFTPQALRYVRFSNLKSHQTWTILRKAGLIRSLTIDIADAGWFLRNPDAATCVNLRELRCVDFNYQPKPKASSYIYAQPSIVDQSDNALRLIESCPKLETLVVDNLSSQYGTGHFTEAVLKSIYNHPSLTKIKIHLDSVPREFRTVLIKSLPTGLKDFELSVKGYLPTFIRGFRQLLVPEQAYPEDGYPWQQQQQQGHSTEPSSFSGSRYLPLERLALGRLHSKPTSRWAMRTLNEDIETAVVIDHVVPNPETRRRHYPYYQIVVKIEIVRWFLERSSGLRHLVLKECEASWFSLLQLLLDNCPDLVTIDLLDSRCSNFHRTNAYSTHGDIQFLGYFPALKEFKMLGYMSEQLYEAVALMLVQSAATLEVVRIDRENDEQALDSANPFHIGTTASWTQCTRLRELVILRNGGSKMTDYRWDIAGPLSVWEPIKDYSTVFGQLERLKLSVRDPLWDQCPDQSYVVRHFNSWYWEEDDGQPDDSDLDEQDDEDWKPLKTSTQTVEEKTQEHHNRRVERDHKRAFILHVREIFGRLMELKNLWELEIDWAVCYSISEMSLEDAMELFRETEVKDNRNDNEYERTSRGWCGEVTEEDLVCLCLPWASRPDVDSSKVPYDLIEAAARQYQNKTQLPGGCNSISACSSSSSSERSFWNTGDIYNTRVGRTWKDWGELTEEGHSTFIARCGECRWFLPCRTTADYASYLSDPYQKMDHNHVFNSPEFEVFVEGILGGGEETRWGRKKATKGEGGRYRQKVVGKANQRK